MISSPAEATVSNILSKIEQIPVIGTVASIFHAFFLFSLGKSGAQVNEEWWMARCGAPRQLLPGEPMTPQAQLNPVLCLRGYVVCPPACVPSGDHMKCVANYSVTTADARRFGCEVHPIRQWGLPLLAVGCILLASRS